MSFDLCQTVRNWESFFPFRKSFLLESCAFERVIKRETCQPAPLPLMTLEMLLPAAFQEQRSAPAATERSQSASAEGRRALPLSFLTLSLEPAESAKQSLRQEVSIGSSPFLMFTRAGFRQAGRSLTAEPMGPKDSKAFFLVHP